MQRSVWRWRLAGRPRPADVLRAPRHCSPSWQARRHKLQLRPLQSLAHGSTHADVSGTLISSCRASNKLKLACICRHQLRTNECVELVGHPVLQL